MVLSTMISAVLKEQTDFISFFMGLFQPCMLQRLAQFFTNCEMQVLQAEQALA